MLANLSQLAWKSGKSLFIEVRNNKVSAFSKGVALHIIESRPKGYQIYDVILRNMRGSKKNIYGTRAIGSCSRLPTGLTSDHKCPHKQT